MGSESEELCSAGERVILGVDGGTTSTVCVCLPLLPFSDHRQLPDPIPVLGRAAAGCSNHNSVGGTLNYYYAMEWWNSRSYLHFSFLFFVIVFLNSVPWQRKIQLSPNCEMPNPCGFSRYLVSLFSVYKITAQQFLCMWNCKFSFCLQFLTCQFPFLMITYTIISVS